MAGGCARADCDADERSSGPRATAFARAPPGGVRLKKDATATRNPIRAA